MLSASDSALLRTAAKMLRDRIGQQVVSDRIEAIAARADQMRLALRSGAHVRTVGAEPPRGVLMYVVDAPGCTELQVRRG